MLAFFLWSREGGSFRLYLKIGRALILLPVRHSFRIASMECEPRSLEEIRNNEYHEIAGP